MVFTLQDCHLGSDPAPVWISRPDAEMTMTTTTPSGPTAPGQQVRLSLTLLYPKSSIGASK